MLKWSKVKEMDMEGNSSRGWMRWAILGGATILAIVGIVIVATSFGGGSKNDEDADKVSQQESAKNEKNEGSKPVVDKPVVDKPLEVDESEKTADLPKTGPEEGVWLGVLALGAVAYGLTFGASELVRKLKQKRES